MLIIVMDNFQGDLADILRFSTSTARRIQLGRDGGGGEGEEGSQGKNSDHDTAVRTLDQYGDPILMQDDLLGGRNISDHKKSCFHFETGSNSLLDNINIVDIVGVDREISPGGGSSSSSACNTPAGIQISPSDPVIKKRKSQTRKVVCIPALAAANSRQGAGEAVPSDLWAWRKYGQKPIKGSPYPRGYYRCSSSKGCSARKQVERSRTDPNMLVITYTSEHNHPWPTQRSSYAGSTRSHGVSKATDRLLAFSPPRPANTKELEQQGMVMAMYNGTTDASKDTLMVEAASHESNEHRTPISMWSSTVNNNNNNIDHDDPNNVDPCYEDDDDHHEKVLELDLFAELGELLFSGDRQGKQGENHGIGPSDRLF